MVSQDRILGPADEEESSARWPREFYYPPSLSLFAYRRRQMWHPPTDVYETDHHVVIKVEVAGMTVEDFDISLVERSLVIAGQRRDPAGKIIYQNMEINYGPFRTEVRLSWFPDQAAIEATYEQGFLFVKLPKPKGYRVVVQTHETDQD